ncbi:MAG TPA: molecular chaperone HtpG [Fibrobacteres bacterium]|jgi:molecular chaperone HtpG|nr:molecular chaperone HtpG [Fibrobacterota bacterium]
MAENAPKEGQCLEFQTEVKQLLQLMIHSLYTNKEVFIRELVSNASDALDKVRFESLTDKNILGDDTDFRINIKLDKNAKTITITDNGIGMNRDEVIRNIGTIARSGSKAFVEKLTGDQKLDSNMIGQFGVGFYSVFMVASKVKLVTRCAGGKDAAIEWESEGSSEYTIKESDKKTRGTEITVYLKDGEQEYVEDWRVRSIIKKYSDFIAFPIYLPNDKGKDEVVNETKPLWKRPPADITKEQYEEFFKTALGGFDSPAMTIHSKAEGVLEYSFLLFVPGKAPFDLFMPERKHGIKLYVKRVFVMEDCKELFPEYLRFIKGVVDSEDLPLNISREMLQNNPTVAKIRKGLVSMVLSRFSELAEHDAKAYLELWKLFGPIIKEGLHSDSENKEKLLQLIRFQSSMGDTDDDVTSLKQYVGRMREGQKYIYYISGDNRSIIEKSPHIEIFREKSIEVLYMVDTVDEWIIPDIYNFEGKELRSIAKGDLDLGDLGKDEKKEKEEAQSEFKKLSERIKNLLSDSVKDVRVTTRLKDSACCLVADEHDMGSYMEKMMKAMGQEFTPAKPVLELNARHPVIVNLKALYEKDAKSSLLDEWAKLLFDQAHIAEGHAIKDPQAYLKRVNDLLVKVSADVIK